MSNRGSRDPNAALEAVLAVLEAGWATVIEVRQANQWRHAQRPQIGKLAMMQGKLSIAQVFSILGEQAMSGKLFGETAVEMGLLKDDLYELLKRQADLTPSLAEALVAQGVITPEQAALVSNQSNTAVLRYSPCDALHEESVCRHTNFVLHPL